MILSLIFPYYRNPGQLALQYAEMTRWSEKAKAQIEIVIVDDGTPEPAVDVERPAGMPALRIFRVLEHRLWFQNGGRKLAAHEDTGVLLSSPDLTLFLTTET